MNFQRVDNEAGNPFNIETWQSEGSRWQVQLNRILFGARVNVRCMDEPDFYLTEYCAGDDVDWQQALLCVVIRILESWDEAVRPASLRGFWPSYGPRPMVNDPTCWNALCRLAHMGTTDIYAIEAGWNWREYRDETHNQMRARRLAAFHNALCRDTPFRATEPDPSVSPSDWQQAKSHFDETRQIYEDLAGGSGINVAFALRLVFQPLLLRFETGERSRELYDLMKGVE